MNIYTIYKAEESVELLVKIKFIFIQYYDDT